MAKIQGGKIYRTISSTAILGIFIAVAILVFAILGFFSLSSGVFGLIFSIAVICISLISSLPWIKRLEDGVLKKASIIFISFIVITAVLWIVAVWLGVMLYNKSVSGEVADKEVAGVLLFVKIATITSTQLMIASSIGNNVVKFKKTMLVLQAVTYASFLFIDFYLVYLLACINIDPASSEIISIADGISFLGNRWMIAFLILSVIFIGISSGIIRAIDNRRMRSASEHLIIHQENLSKAQNESVKEKVEDKLAKLKDLHERELISTEEYETKRKELLKDI